MKTSMMKKIRRIVTAFAVAGLCNIAVNGVAFAAGSIPVGVVLPLTGGMAPFGQASLHGIQLAVDDINAAGGIKSMGGAKLKVVTGDAGSDPTTAASVTQRLISRDRVKAVFGAFASSLSLAASGVTERNRIPFMTMSFSDQLTSRGFKYIFQNVSKASLMGQAQVEYARDIARANGSDLKNIAILYENSAYGTSQAKGIKENAKKLGIHVVLYEGYPHGLSDATPLIQKIKNASPKPDAVFPVSYFTDAVLIVRAMRQNGIDIPIVGGAAGYIIPGFHDALGKNTQGILSADTSNYDHYGKIGKQYRKRYGVFMTHEAFEHAALIYTYAQALEAAGTSDPQKVAQVLHKKDFTGYPFTGLPGGDTDFNAAGYNAKTHPIMVQWQDGELKTVWPKSDATAKAIWK